MTTCSGHPASEHDGWLPPAAPLVPACRRPCMCPPHCATHWQVPNLAGQFPP